MTPDELTKLTEALREKYAVVRDLEARHAFQESREQDAALKLSQGSTDAQSVVSEQAQTKALADALWTATCEAKTLCDQYELEVRKAIVADILSHLQQAADTAGELLDDYIALRKDLGVFDGRSAEEITRTVLTELRLTHSSSYLIAKFKTAFHLPPDIGWQRSPGATSL